jgi:heme/copper-type cytochrome/quinol oxidase subunit 3
MKTSAICFSKNSSSILSTTNSAVISSTAVLTTVSVSDVAAKPAKTRVLRSAASSRNRSTVAHKKSSEVFRPLTTHPFHIVDPSPWPLLASFSAFFRTFGLVRYRHAYQGGGTLFALGLITLLTNASLWWRDVVREATFEGKHTIAVQVGLRRGRILFIVSEIRLFFAFFWAFFHASLSPTPQIGSVWPPRGILPIDPWRIPLLNTVLLLVSGAALTWSHSARIIGWRREVRTALRWTLLLASLFTGFQVFEYLNAPFNIADGVYGSAFYRLTGLHGRHVIVGTIFLTVALYRRSKHHFTVENHLGFETAAWYWHFVDVVWIFLFLAVYVWGQGV